ncbi:tetratricopeptide repeat protein [Idiomarina fontislapidosi]|uniref:Uncharacterized protein n=1 Tax=Idiomarina fontislapidosi TaxID=263723 RepID=A0A432Y8Y6_9GAMM|nr:tetratricopeptide repeat protein [Idiomarina fontislapidosi]PYE34601.1 tetratricopeptide repeat protein [Idiomarina fontislapidosi]RUO57445.1 hypothetical protein CWE25_03000 [Idiomarina fontislapidosi]|tara:strand:+ start:1171 stop:1815 length:645 start_codon:yes stop_codon:yes gene_type:complete
MKSIISVAMSSVLLLSSAQAVAQSKLADIQQRWAEVNYTLQDDAQSKGFQSLAEEAQAWVNSEPNNAAAHIWLGIIKSTEAGAVGGLGALGLAKEAKASLEKALEIEPDALSGSAYASLGTLYYKVPGWPFGFGDDDEAEKLLKKALEINPNGIDSNYFYADFLYEQGNYKQALSFAQHALAAPARPERPLADAERREEIHALIKKVNKRLSKR